MADAAVEKKDAAATEEVTSTEAKESPVKKSPAKKVADAPETNGKEENGDGEVDAADEDTPAVNGDSKDEDESNDASENGDAVTEKSAVKRKSAAADNGDAEEKASEKKAKVADEAPAEIANKYLMSIPPTSVEPERAFSAAAYVGNKLRSRLGSETLDALIFLRLYFRNSK